MNKQLKEATEILLWFLFILLCVFLAGAINQAFSAERVGDNEGGLYRAVCRVYNGSIAGSGTIFHQDIEGNLYVVTNHHVAGANDCTLHFFPCGEQESVKGKNIWRARDDSRSLDVAILKIDYSDVRNITKNLNFCPMLNNGESLSDIEEMITIGAPSAQWVKELKGTIKFKGDETAEFKPTPFGGQSGSGIFIKRDGEYYIGALLTWRSAPEGQETYGGMAQPITRVIGAINNNTSVNVEARPLPENFIPCPGSIDLEKAVKIGGEEEPEKIVFQCSEDKAFIEFWHTAYCSYCDSVEKEWLPEFSKYARIVSFNASGKYALDAEKLKISSYPTIRVIKGGKEYSRYIGYCEANYNAIIYDLKKLNGEKVEQVEQAEQAEQAEKQEKTTQEGLDCIDDSCRLFPPKAESDKPKEKELSGALPFTLPKNGNKEEKKEERKEERIIEKIFPSPDKEQEPKAEKEERGGLFNFKGKIDKELDEQFNKIEKKFNDKIKELSMGVFWLCFLACSLALATYKFTCQIFRCLWWSIKKVFSFISDKISSALSDAYSKLAVKISEKINNKEKE